MDREWYLKAACLGEPPRHWQADLRERKIWEQGAHVCLTSSPVRLDCARAAAAEQERRTVRGGYHTADPEQRKAMAQWVNRADGTPLCVVCAREPVRARDHLCCRTCGTRREDATQAREHIVRLRAERGLGHRDIGALAKLGAGTVGQLAHEKYRSAHRETIERILAVQIEVAA